MIYENVLNKLKNISQNKTELSNKVGLSLVSDIDKWNDFNGLDTPALNEIRAVESSLSDIKRLVSQLESELDTYVVAFGDIVQPIGEYEHTREDARNLKILFENRAEELGVNPSSNESYETIEGQIEMYDDLIEINTRINDSYETIYKSITNLERYFK
jgi:seryl-tRNA synthetase